jgi:CheY-like chemotaxis protein
MKTCRVLIFDDDLVRHPEFLGSVVAGLSSRAGAPHYDLRYRAHADDAVDDVTTFRPHLVLMDFQMGPTHADGASATRELREHFDHDALPILAISSDARFNHRILQAGATEACVKMALPVELGELLQRLVPATSPR